ncbi:unnamed protein product [Coffea canephora]|uniref:Protein kinase domain-containing protein n=1 Tax=Coffea canephora TaxID=49390 RepID=A0A068UIZ3_COFCA|nr:unnamed protein product [Coffea canephora]
MVMKKLSHLYFPLGLFLLGSLLSCLAAPNITSDQSALVSLKAKITGDPHEILASNWSATFSVCDWRGVTCGSRHRRVTALNISNLGLTGTVAPFLRNWAISPFSLLSLGINMLRGNIPSWVGSFQQLRQFFLKNNSFTGFIPPSISNMSKLETLNLQFNSLQGAIPMEIGKLKKLKQIVLDFNQLSVFHPAYVPVFGLTLLDLSLNKLSGVIPPSLSECSKLQLLRLGGNNLSGVIPEGFGNLTALKRLHLGWNNLVGVIPEGYGNLTALGELCLGDNNLIGVIPEGFGNLTALVELCLGGSNLIGCICGRIEIEAHSISLSQLIFSLILSLNLPTFFFGSLFFVLSLFFLVKCNCQKPIFILTTSKTSLSFLILYLNINSLRGTILIEIRNLNKNEDTCTNICRRGNSLGSVPHELGRLKHLAKLALGSNSLTGSIPAQIFNISTLRELDLSNNTLSGRLPSSMGYGLVNLEVLAVFSNEFDGVLPASTSNASKLTHLDLGGNRFSGPVPNSLGNLRLLRYLDLRFYAYGCGIKGSIPDGIGNLSSLIILNLYGNHLSGPVPVTMKYLQNLQALFLDDNQLSGSIPDCICKLKRLYQIYLGQNIFRGSMPSCLNNISSLEEIDFAGNLLNSSIPGSLWNLTDLLTLNLSYNSLSGSLPYETGNLKVVTLLDLSGNHLNGNIPSSLGGLQSLAKLSLAQNKLQGPVPDSLNQMLSLEFLELSNNNLSGPIPKSLETLIYLKYINLFFNHLRGEIPSSDGVSRNTDLLPMGLPKMISYSELVQATNGYDERNLLGKGSFGSVYKGILTDRTRNSVLHTKTLATLGYLAPEYGLEGQVSTRVDVYSFGIVLMETFSRMKPSDEMFKDDLSLKSWIEESLPNATTQVVDANLLGRQDEHFNEKLECISVIFKLALSCFRNFSRDRTNMKDVVAALQKIKRQIKYFPNTSA